MRIPKDPATFELHADEIRSSLTELVAKIQRGEQGEWSNFCTCSYFPVQELIHIALQGNLSPRCDQNTPPDVVSDILIKHLRAEIGRIHTIKQ